MWTHVPGENQDSVLRRLSTRKGGADGVLLLESSPSATPAESIQGFFTHVAAILNSIRGGEFEDSIFLMTGVGIVIRDEWDVPIGKENSWDLYGQLGEDRAIIHYWAVNTAGQCHVAHMDIPKMSLFIHFSPCGNKFYTMDISGRAVSMNKNCNVKTSFYSTSGQRKPGRLNVISP